MDDPPLHTLCPTCHLRPPLYTCPRCHIRSCSLTCVQTHKRRADCTGIRDPTLYKPMRDLATPAGIDHDFNFLSKIERGVERSDRVAVEGGLVAGGEVRGGPGFGQERRGGGRGGGGWRGGEGEVERKVGREVGNQGVRWERLPVGMGRRKANGTSWSKKRGCLVWQVEWVCPVNASSTTTSADDNTTTTAAASTIPPIIPGMLGPLSKILATTPLDEAYSAFLEEARRAALTPEEKAGEKKRRAVEVAERSGGKRVRTSPGVGSVLGDGNGVEALAQEDAQAGVDTVVAAADGAQVLKNADTSTSPPPPQAQSPYTFYLHRPLTLSSGPTVIIPLRGDQGLDKQLSGKVVLEFPRVYVFPTGADVPEGFEVEGVGEEVVGENEEGGGGGEESETSSSGSSSEEEESEEESDGEEGAEEGESDGSEGEEGGVGEERGGESAETGVAGMETEGGGGDADGALAI